MAEKKQAETGMTLREKAARVLDLPEEFLGDSPMVSMVGNREVTVEGCKGIIEYGANVIRLNTMQYMIKISGADLELKSVASEYIHVCGKIAGVEYII